MRTDNIAHYIINDHLSKIPSHSSYSQGIIPQIISNPQVITSSKDSASLERKAHIVSDNVKSLKVISTNFQSVVNKVPTL